MANTLDAMANFIATASGAITTRYIDIFNSFGTDVTIQLYAIATSGWPGTWPHLEAGYEDYATTPTEGTIRCFADPSRVDESANRSTWVSDGGISYPTVVREGIDFRTFYMPPNTASGWLCWNWVAGTDHPELLGRDVVLFLMLDKWYHLTTVIPRFFANQITHYEVKTQMVSDYYWPFENTYDSNYTLVFSERAL